jgi:hypothetical protein
MTVSDQIAGYLATLAPEKRYDLERLHSSFHELFSGGRLWFLDGRNDQGRVVSNPNIGYGCRTQVYSDGSTKEFYQVGLSANTSGISVYVLGLPDKEFLSRNLGPSFGKAKITGYCIQFRRLSDINQDVLLAVLRRAFVVMSNPTPEE